MDIHSQAATKVNPLWWRSPITPEGPVRDGLVGKLSGLVLKHGQKDTSTTASTRKPAYHGREYMQHTGKPTVATVGRPTLVQVLYVLLWAFFAAIATGGY